MNGVLALLGLWLTVTAVVVALILRADKPPVATAPAAAAHDPATCDVCTWATDVGVIADLDFARWDHELQEHA